MLVLFVHYFHFLRPADEEDGQDEGDGAAWALPEAVMAPSNAFIRPGIVHRSVFLGRSK